MNIDWQVYDEKFFQRFCNALISLEVSKGFVPFSAPGRDGGIDGLFSGTYDGKSGNWRFQDKFHKTARKQAYHSLKGDVPIEIRKLANEDYLIILSNVSLLPQEKKELQLLAEQELLHVNKPNVKFDVWDDAKIHTLYIRHPLLRLWLEDDFSTAQLISYQEYFGRRLNAGIEDPSTLANEFIARKSDLKQLTQFVESETENIAVVSGEAGIGKTRLVIEFFKNFIDKEDHWQSLVLNTHRINFDKIAFALSGNVNILILVDDAHTLSPDVIADLRNLIRLTRERKLKLILTGRRLLIDRALELIPVVEDNTIRSIPLEKLSPDETKHLFQSQQNIGRYRDYIPQLASTSNGRPILIVALLRAIHRDTPIPQIKDQDVLKDYVRDYFSSVVNAVSEHTQASKFKLERLLRLLCLLEPLPAKDDAFYAKLAEFGLVDADVLKHFMDELLKEGLALRRYEFVISPDYYSDIMLATAEQQLVVSAIKHFPEFVSHAIVNLSAVDESFEDQRRGRLGLDSILTIYIQILETGNVKTVHDILSTVSSITYQKPEFAKKAIAFFLTRLEGLDSNLLRETLVSDTNNSSNNRESLYGAVSRVLHDLLYRPDNEKFVFQAVTAIHRCVPDLGLFKNTFALDKRHIIHGYNFYQQNIFITEALESIHKDHAQELFFIDAFKDFLSLEVTVSSLDPFKNSQINITTFYISSVDIVVKFRKTCIDALISLYTAAISEDIKTRVVHELMDIPRGISASTRSKNPYHGVDEIVYILEFIESVASKMPLSANREVIDRLYWINKWGADERIISKIAELRKSLEPKSLSEKLVYLLNSAETRMDPDYQKVVDHIMGQSRALIVEYDAETIAESLANVRRVQPNHSDFIWTFNRALYEEFAAKAIEVYDRLWMIDKAYIHQYGSSFLVAIRFKHTQLDYYWDKISELEADGSVESLNVILHVYHRLTERVDSKDVELIERIFLKHKEKWQISFNLFMALATLKNSEYDTSGLIVNLFDICPQRAADNFLTLNRSIEENFLKQLVLHHTIRSQLSFAVQHAIASLLEKQLLSEDELFDYFLRRFQWKSELVERGDFGAYEFVPHHNFNMFSGFDQVAKRRIFMRGLQWYVSSEFKGMADYYAKDLLEFLQPSKELTADLVTEYDLAVDSIADPKQLQRVLTSIDVFESKTRELLDVVVRILKKGTKMPQKELNELQSHGYLAITSVGVKSGAVGEPFAVDVELRELLTEWMTDHPHDDVANEFLSKVIHSLDEQIKRSTDRDETVW